MSEIRLLETIHPTREAMKEFEALFGIDPIKEALGRLPLVACPW
jgi:hypothetical protein